MFSESLPLIQFIMLTFPMKARRSRSLIEPEILKMIKLLGMFLVLMRNGVLYSVFQVQMEVRLSMATSNSILFKEQDNNFWKVTLVLSAKHSSTMKLINQTSSVSLREKQIRKIQQSILLKSQHHHKESKNSKRTLQLTMILKLLMISQLLFWLQRSSVSYT